MGVSLWERLLVTERYRQRAAPDGGFSVPIMLERMVDPAYEPVLVSNTKGKFVVTRVKDGVAKFAFFACGVDEEGPALAELYRTLLGLSSHPGWPTPATTVQEALRKMPFAKSVILSPDLTAEVCGAEFTAEQCSILMQLQGHLAVVNGVQFLSAPLPEKCALLLAAPDKFGVYTRVGNYLGIQLLNVRQTALVVKG